MVILLDPDQEPFVIQPLHHGFAGLKAIQPLEGPGLLIHDAVFVHDSDQGQVVALAHGKVVGVVGGGDLDTAGAKRRIHVLVGNDGNFAI